MPRTALHAILRSRPTPRSTSKVGAARRILLRKQLLLACPSDVVTIAQGRHQVVLVLDVGQQQLPAGQQISSGLHDRHAAAVLQARRRPGRVRTNGVGAALAGAQQELPIASCLANTAHSSIASSCVSAAALT